MGSPTVFAPLTRLQCCPPTCGAAAVLLASPEFMRRHGRGPRVRIAGQAMLTDLPSTFDSGDMRIVMGADLAATAAKAVYQQAGVGPEDVDVVELHDSFTPGELLGYESLGLTPRGTAEKFILDGDNTYGGKVVVNPSGGCCRRGIRWRPPGWRNVPNWCGSCAARPKPGRCRVPGWRCSTTTGWAAPAW